MEKTAEQSDVSDDLRRSGVARTCWTRQHTDAGRRPFLGVSSAGRRLESPARIPKIVETRCNIYALVSPVWKLPCVGEVWPYPHPSP